MKVKYDSELVDERSFSKEDFKRADIDQGAVKFNSKSGFVAEMSEEAFEYLKSIKEPVSPAEDEAAEEDTSDNDTSVNDKDDKKSGPSISSASDTGPTTTGTGSTRTS